MLVALLPLIRLSLMIRLPRLKMPPPDSSPVRWMVMPRRVTLAMPLI